MICSCCKVNKLTNDFSKNSSRPSGLQHRCKQCVSIYNTYTKSVRSAKRKIFYKKHKQKIKMKASKYYKQNKAKCLEACRVYIKRRRETDASFHLRSCISHNIRQNIIKKQGKKEGSIFKHLPYTLNELKTHLENLFEPWMDWNNYGGRASNRERTWWVDHKIPQSLLPYDSLSHPNFTKCWALSNLQPMEKIQNILKGKTLCPDS